MIQSCHFKKIAVSHFFFLSWFANFYLLSLPKIYILRNNSFCFNYYFFYTHTHSHLVSSVKKPLPMILVYRYLVVKEKKSKQKWSGYSWEEIDFLFLSFGSWRIEKKAFYPLPLFCHIRCKVQGFLRFGTRTITKCNNVQCVCMYNYIIHFFFFFFLHRKVRNSSAVGLCNFLHLRMMIYFKGQKNMVA